MIPKIIHQLWVGPKKPPHDLMKTWRDNHPDWEYMFWNEESIKEHFPNGLYNQKQYDEMPEWNGKCDIARYEILDKFGGFFVDADAVSLRPLDDYLLENDSFSCYENEFLRGQLIACGYFGAQRDCELVRHNIDAIHELSGNTLWEGGVSAWKTVGPVLMSRLVHQYRYNKLAIYPSFYFIPKHYTKQCIYEGPFKPYADQWWGSTPNNPDYNYES